VNNILIEENVELAPYTTMQIGGRARFFVRAATQDDVAECVRFAAESSLPLFVLGGGSNVLIADGGFDGVVLHIALKGIETVDGSAGLARVTAQAGEEWDHFVEFTVNEGLAGLECLSGIPGYVGGTPVQNVGAYGQEVAESISLVRVLDRLSGSVSELSNAECGFAYRSSIFNSTKRERYIVLAVTFDLTPGGEPKVTYRDLKEHFAGRMPTLAETRAAVLDIRRAKSMVIDAADPNSKSAGSFFKNPIVSREKFAAIAAEHPDVPSFPAGTDSVKIPAAWLIEKAGIPKGFSLGNAGISTKHTLAIVNHGGNAADIMRLKELIQSRIKAVFGIELVPEPVFVGF